MVGHSGLIVGLYMQRGTFIFLGFLTALALWLFVALPLIHMSPSAALRVNEAPKQSEKTERRDANDDTPPSVALTRGALSSKPLFVALTCDEHDDNADCAKGWLAKFLTDPVATFTGLLFIATFLQAYFTWKALVESQRANAAARSAENNTQTALIITNRPYVFVRDFVPIAVGNPDQPLGWTCVVLWENSGATPTQRLKMWVSWARFTAPVPDDYPFLDRGEGADDTVTIIPPRGQVSTPVFTLDIEHAVSLMERRSFTYIWGWAEYDDLFPYSPRRRTEFCVQVLVDQIGDHPLRLMVQFRHHRAHNSAS